LKLASESSVGLSEHCLQAMSLEAAIGFWKPIGCCSSNRIRRLTRNR